MKRFNWLQICLVVLCLTMTLPVGCVPKSDYEALQAENAALLDENESVKADYDELKASYEAPDTYLSSGKAPNISAEELYELLYDDNPDNDSFILSVRSHEYYEKGHIPGAINIPWRQVAKKSNLARLPKDRQIVVYCYTGHTASQITALLNILGYDAINLKFGMTSWTINKDIAPGRYEEAKHSHNYPLVIKGIEVSECPACGK